MACGGDRRKAYLVIAPAVITLLCCMVQGDQLCPPLGVASQTPVSCQDRHMAAWLRLSANLPTYGRLCEVNISHN